MGAAVRQTERTGVVRTHGNQGRASKAALRARPLPGASQTHHLILTSGRSDSLTVTSPFHTPGNRAERLKRLAIGRHSCETGRRALPPKSTLSPRTTPLGGSPRDEFPRGRGPAVLRSHAVEDNEGRARFGKRDLLARVSGAGVESCGGEKRVAKGGVRSRSEGSKHGRPFGSGW